jgi:hypothetical protein
MKRGYFVTWTSYTNESIEHGDFAEQGYTRRDGTLRQAIEALGETGTAQCECTNISPSSNPIDQRTWIDCDWRFWKAGNVAGMTMSLHFPPGVTASSRSRVLRLLCS